MTWDNSSDIMLGEKDGYKTIVEIICSFHIPGFNVYRCSALGAIYEEELDMIPHT